MAQMLSVLPSNLKPKHIYIYKLAPALTPFPVFTVRLGHLSFLVLCFAIVLNFPIFPSRSDFSIQTEQMSCRCSSLSVQLLWSGLWY